MMSYMDNQDKKIQEQMKNEGKIKIPNFNEIVKKFFKSNYDKEGYFEFLYVEYEFYDKDYQIYNLDIGDFVPRPQNRKIRQLLPFFIEQGTTIDARMFSLQIPSIIDINNLDSEISSRLPEGITHITINQIKELLYNEGYEEPFFDHYFYSGMDYPSYNLYARPILKTKSSIADADISQKLEQAYMDGTLKQTGVIDTKNFPQDVPDKETCEMLDDLFLKKQLASRQVRYCIVYSNEPMHITDYFDEYTYNDRKFIRYQSLVDGTDCMTLSNHDTIEKNKFYWIEVKPIDFSKEQILYTGFDTSKSGRKM